jgi:hypothetical protein
MFAPSLCSPGGSLSSSPSPRARSLRSPGPALDPLASPPPLCPPPVRPPLPPARSLQSAGPAVDPCDPRPPAFPQPSRLLPELAVELAMAASSIASVARVGIRLAKPCTVQGCPLTPGWPLGGESSLSHEAPRESCDRVLNGWCWRCRGVLSCGGNALRPPVRSRRSRGAGRARPPGA